MGWPVCPSRKLWAILVVVGGPDLIMEAGLCATCAHVKPVDSSKAPVYYLCRLSESDPRFPKYPRLPVLQCGGYRACGPPADVDDLARRRH